ncbi:hypothetical protein K435DRAFT_577130, partial [Dendrothele bispora CBS 962.96]
QETIFRLQGVIYEKELPPLKISRLQPLYLRQHAGITGLGLPYMTHAVENFHQIFASFQRMLNQEELTPWTSNNSYQPFEGVTANCRYFTAGTNTSTRQSIPFQKDIDPEGDGIVHTEENTVLYMKASKSGPNSKWRYSDISPSSFLIGDIVEIQFTVMSICQKEGNYKMITILKSLTVLD